MTPPELDLSEGDPVVLIVKMSPGVLDFIIAALPHDDEVTKELVRAKLGAMSHLWGLSQ